MKDDTGRPGSGDKGVPQGTRARNRTMIIGTERVGGVVQPVERMMPAKQVVAKQEAHDLDPLGLDAFEQGEFEVTETRHDDFQSLDEIFGAVRESSEKGDAHQTAPSFDAAPKDASSTLMGHLGLDDDFQAVLDVFEPSVATPAPVPASKIVRSTSGNLTPQPQILATDVFDPFASIESEEPEGSNGGVEQSVLQGDDFESVLGGPDENLSVEDEVVEVGPSLPVEHRAEIGAANERLIVPSSLSAGTPIVSGAIKTEEEVAPQHQANGYQVSTEYEDMNEPRDHIYWKSESPLVGFLVTYDHDPKGSYVELRHGRLMVSNQREESGSCFVVIGESVSPMHAIMRVGPGGHVQVLDQLSESGTRVKHAGQSEEEFLSGEKSRLSHGDIVFFGDRKFHVLLIVGESEE